MPKEGSCLLISFSTGRAFGKVLACWRVWGVGTMGAGRSRPSGGAVGAIYAASQSGSESRSVGVVSWSAGF